MIDNNTMFTKQQAAEVINMMTGIEAAHCQPGEKAAYAEMLNNPLTPHDFSSVGELSRKDFNNPAKQFEQELEVFCYQNNVACISFTTVLRKYREWKATAFATMKESKA